MKKIALLLFPLLISLQALAQDNALRELGLQFCYDYIENLRPGTYHLMSCIDYVDRINLVNTTTPQMLIENICNESPNFYGLDGYISAAQCIDDAREMGFCEMR